MRTSTQQNIVVIPAFQMKRIFSNDQVLSLEEILEDCCNILGQKIEDVKSPRKYQELVTCRTVFCWAACKYRRYSLNEIGEALGGRDHTTVIYSREKAKFYLSVNDDKFMPKYETYVLNSILYNSYIHK